MILDGKSIKNIILDEVKDEVVKLEDKLKLVVIQVNNNPASDVYIKQKKNMCDYVGYDFQHVKLDEGTDTESLLDIINGLNNDNSVTGIFVQLPLPNGIDTDKIVNKISPLKDVDGLSDFNKNRLLHEIDGLYSCTASGVMELLDRYEISVSNKNVVIIGRSKLVGKPLEVMMKNKGANVTVCHSKTDNLSKFTIDANIIISAVGKPKLITEDMVSTGVIIVDVGISRTEDGICGDVDYCSIKNKCSYITPVPGGVGPMTVAMLARNILKAYNLQNKN